MSDIAERAKLHISNLAQGIYSFIFEQEELVICNQDDSEFIFLRSKRQSKDILDEEGNPTGETTIVNDPIVWIEIGEQKIKLWHSQDNYANLISQSSRIVVLCPKLFIRCKDGKAIDYSGMDVTDMLPVLARC